MEKARKYCVSISTGCGHILKTCCKISCVAILVGLCSALIADKIEMKQRKIKFNKQN